MPELSHLSYEDVLRGISGGWAEVVVDLAAPQCVSARVWLGGMTRSRQSKSRLEAEAASIVELLLLDASDVHELALDYIGRYGSANVALHSAKRMAARRARSAVWGRVTDLEYARRELDASAGAQS